MFTGEMKVGHKNPSLRPTIVSSGNMASGSEVETSEIKTLCGLTFQIFQLPKDENNAKLLKCMFSLNFRDNFCQDSCLCCHYVLFQARVGY